MAGAGAGPVFTGENKILLEGVAGFRGDLLGIFTAGDLTGEHRRSSSCCDVTRRGLLVGNKEEVVALEPPGLLGDRNRLAAALLGSRVLQTGPAGTLGELRRSSSWLEESSLGDLENNDFVGSEDCLDGVFGLGV